MIKKLLPFIIIFLGIPLIFSTPLIIWEYIDYKKINSFNVGDCITLFETAPWEQPPLVFTQKILKKESGWVQVKNFFPKDIESFREERLTIYKKTKCPGE